MKIYFNLIMVLVLSGVLSAQTGSIGSLDARSAGLGKSSTISSRGVFSIGINPANMIFEEDNHFEFSTELPIPNINVRAGTDFITIKDYNYFFGGVQDANGNTVGRHLNESDKNRLRALFEKGGTFISDVTTSILSINYKVSDEVGAFGFGIYDIVSAKIVIPEQLIDLGLSGNPIGKMYNFNDAKGKGWWLRNYSLAYSRTLPDFTNGFLRKIAAGITIKYVQGFAYAGLDKVETSIETNTSNQIKAYGNMLAYSSFSNDFHVKYDFDSTSSKQDAKISLFPSPAGSGLGFDIGFSAQVNDIWSFGLAVTDIGNLKWNKNVAKYSSNTAIVLNDITNKTETDSLKDAITGKGEYAGEFSTSLPTALRFGVSFQLDKFLEGKFPGTMLIVFDYNQGFNNQPRNSTEPRISLGAEWKPMDWIPFIRTGFSAGGGDSFGWAFGLGINAGILEFNFASPDFHYLFMANQAKRVSLALDSRWKF